VASNRYAAPQDTYGDTLAAPHLTGFDGYDRYADGGTATATASATAPAQAAFGPEPADDAPRVEWNPSADTVRPARGRHRVARPRGGTMARSRAVLGVGVMAAVGAGGMASANESGAGALPGMDAASAKIRSIPSHLPLVGGLMSDGSGSEQTTTAQVLAAAPLTTAGMTEADLAAGQSDAGEALRARILQQADQQEFSAESRAREAAVTQAREAAIQEAAEQAEQERREEEERRRREEEERRRREEEERLARLRASYTLPLSDYTLSSSFGASGSMWSSTHTGQDFAAPTGTPVKNVHTGTVTEAAWAGSYGYRIIVQLEDGTELWYCHLSSMNVVAGQEVSTGDVIGQVGSTGNSTGPHLHLEVLPGGGSAVDPLAWLRDKGLSV
jgi:murein DD-endopeptidase MepM/ murein hydrolase activator NlpD